MALNLSYHIMAEYSKVKREHPKEIEQKAKMDQFMAGPLKDRIDEENEKEELVCMVDGEGGFEVDLESRQRAMRNITNKNFLNFLRLFGNLLRSLRGAINERRFKDVANITDVELGNDLKKLLASERIGLSSGKLAKYKKFQLLTKRLLQWKCESNQDADNGAVNIWVDLSASMSTNFDSVDGTMYGRDEMALATAAAMIAQLTKEGRAYRVNVFTVTGRKILDSLDKMPLMAQLQLCMMQGVGGGTDFRCVFDDAELLKDLESGADLCLITDGECSHELDDTLCWPRFKSKLNKLHLLKIGCTAPCYIEPYATSILHASSFQDMQLYSQKVFI
jgi:uncharacterized protein with von Willebrand factor type A (vWA) domain